MPNFHIEWFRLMINNSLDEGTQLPYIRKALGLGYGVVVLNTNDNKSVEVGSAQLLPFIVDFIAACNQPFLFNWDYLFIIGVGVLPQHSPRCGKMPSLVPLFLRVQRWAPT